MMKHLIAGFGDVGRGLYELLGKHYSVVAIDKDNDLEGKFDVLHVCFPYSGIFTDIVNKYINKYNPNLIIIHSTVPPGTTEGIKLADTVHSPIRGRHPHMANDIKTYTKYFGGDKSSKAAKIFSDIGITTECFKDSKTTELGKLLSNIRWGLNIAFAQEQKRMCEHYGVRYEDVVNNFEKSCNKGRKQLERDNSLMPILFPGYIGGHCVLPNVDILFATFPSQFLRVIIESNEKYIKENKNLETL